MERISRSFDIVVLSYRILLRDKELMVLPLISAAGRRIGTIVVWALVAATVGTIIRAIHDRVGFVGKVIGLASLVAWLPLMGISALVAFTIAFPVGVSLFFAGAIVLSIFFSTLNGIYLATLFRYATEGWVPAGFSGELLQQAFVSKDGSNHTTLNLHRRQ